MYYGMFFPLLLFSFLINYNAAYLGGTHEFQDLGYMTEDPRSIVSHRLGIRFRLLGHTSSGDERAGPRVPAGPLLTPGPPSLPVARGADSLLSSPLHTSTPSGPLPHTQAHPLSPARSSLPFLALRCQSSHRAPSPSVKLFSAFPSSTSLFFTDNDDLTSIYLKKI